VPESPKQNLNSQQTTPKSPKHRRDPNDRLLLKTRASPFRQKRIHGLTAKALNEDRWRAPCERSKLTNSPASRLQPYRFK
jgi:hypothetical protein